MRILTLSDHGQSERRGGGITASIGQRLLRWHELSRQRRQLARLDERTLRDIGITHYDARQEARRWFWDDPLA
ncbi:MAG: DUF1127 domain-containing protein [Pseudomonadota bacterium]